MPNIAPMAVPPRFFGVASSSHACSTGRMAKRKKPSSATKATKTGEPPANTMKNSTTPVMIMEDMMTLRRPILSDIWPAIGAATKPAACRVNMATPVHHTE